MVNTEMTSYTQSMVSTAAKETMQVAGPIRAVPVQPQAPSKFVSRAIIVLMLAFVVFNYLATEGRFSDAVAAGGNLAICGLAMLVHVWKFGTDKQKRDWKEFIQRIFFFGAVFASSMMLGLTGALSATTQGWLNLSPLMVFAAYKLYHWCKK